MFSYLVGPIVDWMQVKPKMPRGVSILFALLVVLGLITLIIMLITVSARGIAASAPIYRERLASMAQSIFSILDRFDIDLGQIYADPRRSETDPFIKCAKVTYTSDSLY